MDQAELDDLGEILGGMAKADPEAFMQATRLLLQIVYNLAHNPNNKRFHKLKTGGKQVSKILRLEGVVKVLRILGFSEKIDFFYLPEPPSPSHLQQCIGVIVDSRKALGAIEAWELFHQDIDKGPSLGSGKFGEVLEGTLRGEAVAIKALKVEEATPLARAEFLQEANLMKLFKHNNVIKLVGVVFQQSPPLIVMELMGNCLVDLLREETMTFKEILDRAMQVAAGMEYVHHHDVLHCDIAARNVLVSFAGVLKITDFGLARHDGSPECDLTDQPVKFPIRWTAPEVFTSHFLTKQSDVWAYGVLFYEILTEGNTPYRHLNNKGCKAKVLAGYRLPKPKSSPDEFYDIIRQCWLEIAQERPSFNSIVQKLLVLKTIMAAQLSNQMVKKLAKKAPKSGHKSGPSRANKSRRWFGKSEKRRAKAPKAATPDKHTGMVLAGSGSGPAPGAVFEAAAGRRRSSCGSMGSGKNLSRSGVLRIFTTLVAADQVFVVIPISTTTKARQVVTLSLAKAGKGKEDPSKFTLVETGSAGYYRVVGPSEHPLAFTTAPQFNAEHELYLCPKPHAANVHELIRLRKTEETEAYESAVQNLAPCSQGFSFSDDDELEDSDIEEGAEAEGSDDAADSVDGSEDGEAGEEEDEAADTADELEEDSDVESRAPRTPLVRPEFDIDGELYSRVPSTALDRADSTSLCGSLNEGSGRTMLVLQDSDGIATSRLPSPVHRSRAATPTPTAGGETRPKAMSPLAASVSAPPSALAADGEEATGVIASRLGCVLGRVCSWAATRESARVTVCCSLDCCPRVR